jgi:hypothetical protein
VVAIFFEIELPTLIAERGDQVSLMVRQRSDNGAKYQGRNKTFWEHQGEAIIVWGCEAPDDALYAQTLRRRVRVIVLRPSHPNFE